MPTKDERIWATAIYAISFFTAFIGPIVIWLVKREESPYIDHHGKEYLNFLISYVTYSVVSIILMIVIIGFFTIWLVGLFSIIFTIIGAIKAYDGTYYRIPFIFRLIR